MFHNTNVNDFCSETGSSTASLLCGSTVGYPSDSLASCLCIKQWNVSTLHCHTWESWHRPPTATRWKERLISCVSSSHLPIQVIYLPVYDVFCTLQQIHLSEHAANMTVFTCIQLWIARSVFLDIFYFAYNAAHSTEKTQKGLQHNTLYKHDVTLKEKLCTSDQKKNKSINQTVIFEQSVYKVLQSFLN